MIRTVLVGTSLSLLVAGGALAHTPMLKCKDGPTVTCTASMSNGEGLGKADFRVMNDAKKTVITTGKGDPKGMFSFKKPAVAYYVVFATGEQDHTVMLASSDIK